MLLTETAILVELQAVRVVLPVFHRIIITLFARRAGYRNTHSHLLHLLDRGCLYLKADTSFNLPRQGNHVNKILNICSNPDELLQIYGSHVDKRKQELLTPDFLAYF